MLLLGKLKVYLIMFAAFAVFAGVAYWYYQDSQAAIKQYAENQAKLQVALEQQKAATASLMADVKSMNRTITKLNKDFAESRIIVSDLQTALTQDGNGNARDIGKNAIANPPAMEVELNKGTIEAFNCIEIISGNTGDYSEAEYFNCTNGTDTTGM